MITKEFVLAGKAIFTLELPAEFAAKHGCKPHYTYRVNYSEATAEFPEAWWVGKLTGPENIRDYSDVGKVNAFTGEVTITKLSKFTKDSMTFKLINRVLARVWAGDTAAIEAAGFKLHNAGRCGRCLKTLTVPESIESGFGPECRGKVAGAA